MKLLLTIREQDIYPDAEPRNPTHFLRRQAARAIVRNSEGRIALLKVGNQNYHKLPGGGVEAGEDILEALRRELLEEIGCEATVTSEVGKIVEHRDKWELLQTSYCYSATQLGPQQAPAFTDDELRDGFEVVWVQSVEAAVTLLARDKPANYDGRFIQKRDLTFLRQLYSQQT